MVLLVKITPFFTTPKLSCMYYSYDYERTISRKNNIDKRFLKVLSPEVLPLIGHPAESSFAVPWVTEGLPTQTGFILLMRREDENVDGNSETPEFRRVRKYKKNKDTFMVLEKAADLIHELFSVEDHMFMMEQDISEEGDVVDEEENNHEEYNEPETLVSHLDFYMVMVNGSATITTDQEIAVALGGVLVDPVEDTIAYITSPNMIRSRDIKRRVPSSRRSRA